MSMTRLPAAEIISSIAMDTIRTYTYIYDGPIVVTRRMMYCTCVSSARAICSRVFDNELSPRLFDERCRTASRRMDGRYTWSHTCMFHPMLHIGQTCCCIRFACARSFNCDGKTFDSIWTACAPTSKRTILPQRSHERDKLGAYIT